MRLINAGCGEISDRLTILALKILIGTEQGKDVKHFANERTALLTKLGAQTLNGAWFDHVLDLAAVNAALWHAEDDLRDVRREQCMGADIYVKLLPHAGELGIRIQSLNDQRAGLVQAINEKTGNNLGEEKL